jgi:predicted RNase H-like HicB family nuclease
MRSPRIKVVNEIVFEITQEADGGFCAECLTESIFTQGDTWDELRANVSEAVEAFYFDRPKPASIRLHLVRDEMLALG